MLNVEQTKLPIPPAAKTSNLSSSPITTAIPNSPITVISATAPTTNNDQQDASADVQKLVGSASRGVYVSAELLEKITTKLPTNYVLKLFELVFSRREASVSSVEGKAEKLLKLDANRLTAVFEHHLHRFKSDNTLSWEAMKKIIDSKCRMVRNNRCKTWAGSEN